MLIKLEWLGYRVVIKLWPYVKLFSSDTGTLRPDGRTDRFAISISRVSMLARDKNSRVGRMHTSKPTVQQYQQCCHHANGNKTCCSLLLFKNNNMARGSKWFVRQSSRNVALRVEQHLCLTSFFQNYNILPRSVVRAGSLRVGSENTAKFVTFWPTL